MGESIHIHSQSLMGQRAKTPVHLVALRLITGYALLIVSLVGLLGGDWDIQWHAVIGRDRTFTPPHDMILISIALNGLVALASILVETWWAQHNRELQENSTDFLGIFHSSLGTYLVGFAAVCSAVAFPLDTYWHALYGIDVSIWAPFHTMLYVGGFIALIGLIYILISAVHLAQKLNRNWLVYLGYAGAILASAFLLSRLATYIIPSISVNIAGISLFPILLCVCVAFACTIAVRLVPWPSTATLVIIALLLAFALVSAFVPPMIIALMQAEHQVYLPGSTFLRSTVVPLLAQTPWLLLSGLSIDGIVFLSKRGRWSAAARNWGVAIAAAVSTAIVAGLKLLELASAAAAFAGSSSASGGHQSILPFLLALIIAIPGGLLGNWLGSIVSGSVETLRR
jgi:hypothetical protein